MDNGETPKINPAQEGMAVPPRGGQLPAVSQQPMGEGSTGHPVVSSERAFHEKEVSDDSGSTQRGIITAAVGALPVTDRETFLSVYEQVISGEGDATERMNAIQSLPPNLRKLLVQKLANEGYIEDQDVEYIESSEEEELEPVPVDEADETVQQELKSAQQYFDEVADLNAQQESIDSSDEQQQAELQKKAEVLKKRGIEIDWGKLRGKTLSFAGKGILITGGIIAAIFLLLAMSHGGKGGRR